MTVNCLKEIDVVVLAGGLGTRLANSINGKPKILAPVAGRPYLNFVLKWFASFGARRIILSLGYLAHEVESYVHLNETEELEIICAVEPEPLGTAGGLAFSSSFIESDPVLVMNGDCFVDADICKFVEYHQTNTGEISILSTIVPNASRYGLLEVDSEGQIISFIEKNEDNRPGTINAGVYMMNKSIFQNLQHIKKGSLERDVFPRMKLGSINTFTGNFDFIDIGTPQTYLSATKILKPYLKRWDQLRI